MSERLRAAKTKDHEHLMLYRDLGVADADMDLLLQLAFISTMGQNSDHCWTLADALEVLHPHHAGAFIVRGLRHQAEGNLLDATFSYIVGMQADIKAKESVSLCLGMLEMNGLGDLDIAFSLRGVIQALDFDDELYKAEQSSDTAVA